MIAGTFLVLAISYSSREPVYQGRPLSAWLRGFESDSRFARWESAEAIRGIGSNSLPVLMTYLRSPVGRHEPKWRQTLQFFLNKQRLFKVNHHDAPDLREQAFAALYTLGPAAMDAVPEMERLLHENPPDHRALLVLARIGPAGEPALAAALTNSERVVQIAARACFLLRQSRSRAIFPMSPQDEGQFQAAECALNLAELSVAIHDYKALHPEQFSSP